MKNEKIVIFIGMIAAIVLFVSFIRTPKLDPVATPTPTVREYTIFEETYMEGCFGEAKAQGFDAPYSYCKCTYDYMVDELGIDGFLEMAMDYYDDEIFTDEMLDAIDFCYYKLDI